MMAKLLFMALKINKNSFFIFDLDDTLYPEIEFLKSGYKSIAEKILPLINTNIYDEMIYRHKNGEKVFEWIVTNFSDSLGGITVSHLLTIYRNHFPTIKMTEGAKDLMKNLIGRGFQLGLITDGRKITQRNKLKALQIEDYFVDIIISDEFGSEKPNEKNFLFFEQKYPEKNFIYIGDNTSKDFKVPCKIGWQTICLKDSGCNIHKQNFDDIANIDLIVNSFQEINLFFNLGF